MRIGFIGAGKAATAFGLYLKDKNQIISGYYSPTNTSAISAAACVQTETFQTLETLVLASDIIGIATPDDQIEAVVKELANLELGHSKVFFHMSGAKSSACLYPIREKGHHCLSLHPLQTLSDPVSGRVLLGRCLYTVEGDEGPEIDTFLNCLDRPVTRITAEQKPFYHAAACVASNYLYTLADQAIQLMTLAGFSPSLGYEALRPLMEGTLNNLESHTPAQALTGPIARGDAETVAKHLDALSEHESLLRVYKQLGLETLQLASLSRLQDSEKIKALETLLKVKEEQVYEIK